MNIRPLTKDQQSFASENHNLVYSFLNKRGLPESVFYDIVIFGYLRAVQKYCEIPSLHRFRFSTLAWKHMRSSLYNYYRYLSRPKRSAPTISFDAISADSESLYQNEPASQNDEMMIRFETELLLHTLASKLPCREMRIICMKVRGDRMHDIAKAERMTFHDINQTLQKCRPAVTDVLWG